VVKYKFSLCKCPQSIYYIECKVGFYTECKVKIYIKYNIIKKDWIILTEAKIKIEGMMCGHCQASVTKAISSVGGVSAVKVDLADKQATVSYDPKKTNL
jgi:copper chaperone